jgi:membrane-bound inhibitor of C-type lysozyme
VRKIIKRRSVRIAVVSAAGLVGAGAMGILAIPATAAVPTVTFKGGCQAASASSAPNRTEITAQKSSASQDAADVVVVNKLNTSGTLYADGKVVKWPGGDVVVLDKGDSITVPFTSGEVDLTLIPECDVAAANAGSKKNYQSVTVSVLAAALEAEGGALDSDQSGADQPATADGSGADTAGTDTTGGESPSPGVPGSSSAAAQQSMGPDAVPSAASDRSAPVTADGGTPRDVPADDVAAAPLVPKNHTSGISSVILAWIAALCLLGVVVATLRTLMQARSARVSGS